MPAISNFTSVFGANALPVEIASTTPPVNETAELRANRIFRAAESARTLILERYGIRIDPADVSIRIRENPGLFGNKVVAFVPYDGVPGGIIHVNLFKEFYDRASDELLVHLLTHEYMHVLSESAGLKMSLRANVPFLKDPVFRDPGNFGTTVPFPEVLEEGGAEYFALKAQPAESRATVLASIRSGALGYPLHLQVFSEITDVVGEETARKAFFLNDKVSQQQMAEAAEDLIESRQEYRRRATISTVKELAVIFDEEQFAKMVDSLILDYCDGSLSKTKILRELETELAPEQIFAAQQYLATPREMRIIEQHRHYQAVFDQLTQMTEKERSNW